MSGGVSIGEVATAVAAAAASAYVANSMAPKPGSNLVQQAAAPTVAPPPVTPLPDGSAVQAAKVKQIAASQAASGRASTILTDNVSDKLG